MKLLRHTAICVAFSAIGITSTFAQHVVTDFDHQANFSTYKNLFVAGNQTAQLAVGLAHKERSRCSVVGRGLDIG